MCEFNLNMLAERDSYTMYYVGLSPQVRTTDWDFLVANDPLLYFNSPSHSHIMYPFSNSTIRLCTLNCTFAQVSVKFP